MLQSIWAKEKTAALAFTSEDLDFHDMKFADDDLPISLQPLPLLSKRWQSPHFGQQDKVVERDLGHFPGWSRVSAAS